MGAMLPDGVTWCEDCMAIVFVNHECKKHHEAQRQAYQRRHEDLKHAEHLFGEEVKESRLLVDRMVERYDAWCDKYWWLFIVFLFLVAMAVTFG